MKGVDPMLTSIKTICEEISNELIINSVKFDEEFNEFSQLIKNGKTNYYEENNLICIASRPGMGKTTLALDIVLDAAINSDNKILIFSLDMSAKMIVFRIIQTLSGVNFYMFGDCVIKETDKNKVSSTLAFLQELNILIDDTPAITPDYVEKCLQNHKNASLVMIDYIQLMQMNADKHLCQQELIRINEIYRVSLLVLTQLGRNSSLDYLIKNSDTVIFLNRKTGNDNDIEITVKTFDSSERFARL